MDQFQHKCFLDAFDGFQSAYKTMEKKTRFLNSPNIFEDVIHREVVALFTKEPSVLNDNLILSWIIDPKSLLITNRKWFTPGELLEIQSWKLPLPQTEKYFDYSYSRFSKVWFCSSLLLGLSAHSGHQAHEVDEFRRILETCPCRAPHTRSDPSRDSDAAYVNIAIDTASVLLSLSLLLSLW